MDFVKYQHIERFGTSEVEGIEFGECYVFPKIDGTNASVWMCEGEVCAGSRRRELSIEQDNAGFCTDIIHDKNILNYLNKFPNHRLFGEWLVPHSLKTYRKNAWKKFYVFDVMVDKSYLHYDEYQSYLEDFGVEYIPPIRILKNGTYEQFVKLLDANEYLIENGKGFGEGIVIKRYDYVNKYGRTTWAKIVGSEFKEKHHKAMGAPLQNGTKIPEEEAVNSFLTKAMIDKVYAKIEQDGGFRSKDIPRLLHTVYHDFVIEEIWQIIKKQKNPVINFKTLQHFTFAKVKAEYSNLF